VTVTAADPGDRTAAQVLPQHATDAHHRPGLIWADGGYTGSLIESCRTALAPVLASPSATTAQEGVVLPKRWAVERLFAPLVRTRRPVCGVERRTTGAGAMV